METIGQGKDMKFVLTTDSPKKLIYNLDDMRIYPAECVADPDAEGCKVPLDETSPTTRGLRAIGDSLKLMEEASGFKSRPGNSSPYATYMKFLDAVSRSAASITEAADKSASVRSKPDVAQDITPNNDQRKSV